MPDANRSTLGIQVTHLPDGTLIRVSGDIDMSTVGTLSDALEDSKGSNRVVIDLSDVFFIGSAGLAVLISSCQQLADAGGTLVLRQPQPQALRLFEITQLDALFDIESLASG
jgi:anti-sigma B factor antagonist